MSHSSGMNLHNNHSTEPGHSDNPAADTLIESDIPGVNDVVSKLEKDIAFLENRIQRAKAQKCLNKSTLRTYEDMLQRRCIILEKIRQGEMPNFDF